MCPPCIMIRIDVPTPPNHDMYRCDPPRIMMCIYIDISSFVSIHVSNTTLLYHDVSIYFCVSMWPILVLNHSIDIFLHIDIKTKSTFSKKNICLKYRFVSCISIHSRVQLILGLGSQSNFGQKKRSKLATVARTLYTVAGG